MLECNLDEPDQDWEAKNVIRYCPDYKPEIHFIYGGFYSKKYSWQRLALHLCDDSPEAEAKRI